MLLSAKKQRKITNPETKTQNVVNENDSINSDDVEVTDDYKYQELLEKRKTRRTVSLMC